MADQIGWHPEAYEEFREIGEDSPAYAATVATRIVSLVDDLLLLPLMGPRVPEWDEDTIRQRIVYQYRVIYRVRDGKVLILAVIHGARDLPDEIRERG